MEVILAIPCITITIILAIIGGMCLYRGVYEKDKTEVRVAVGSILLSFVCGR